MHLFWSNPQFCIKSVDDWKKFLEKKKRDSGSILLNADLISAINSTESLMCLNVEGIW